MNKPLSSLKILDFSTLLPGPYATLMLADLGAEVLRIEAPNRVDLARIMPPFAGGVSAQQAVLGRNKRSLGLDLKQDGADELVKRLVQRYDIVVEQFRPGVMDRLGVGYEALKAVNPALIFCSLTGYGQTGPYKDRAGHDINYLALSGLMSYYGRKGEVPAPLPMQVADVGAGSLHLVIGLLTAVIQRQATNEGTHVDISMSDGALMWNALGIAGTVVSGKNPKPEEGVLNGGIFYDFYETKDGRLLSVGSLEPKFWAGFCQTIEKPELIELGLKMQDAQAQAEVKTAVCTAIKQKTLDEWVALFATTDVCVEPVLTTEEAIHHPHATARQMLVDVPLPDGSPQKQVGTPIKMSNFDPTYNNSGGHLGADSVAVLQEAGFSPAEIEGFVTRGVVSGGSERIK